MLELTRRELMLSAGGAAGLSLSGCLSQITGSGNPSYLSWIPATGETKTVGYVNTETSEIVKKSERLNDEIWDSFKSDFVGNWVDIDIEDVKYHTGTVPGTVMEIVDLDQHKIKEKISTDDLYQKKTEYKDYTIYHSPKRRDLDIPHSLGIGNKYLLTDFEEADIKNLKKLIDTKKVSAKV